MTKEEIKAKLFGSEKNEIKLQGIGYVTAKPAGKLKEGDTLVWNYGYKSTVKEIRETKKCVFITSESLQNGKQYERRMMKTRLVGVA